MVQIIFIYPRNTSLIGLHVIREFSGYFGSRLDSVGTKQGTAATGMICSGNMTANYFSRRLTGYPMQPLRWIIMGMVGRRDVWLNLLIRPG